jgi:serine/threonine protein kinase
MSMPISADELIQLIRVTGLVEERRLEAYRHRTFTPPASESERAREARELAEALVADALLTTFQATQLLLGKRTGYSVGKYRILERIGSGGMGQVYLCEHVEISRRVAIKVLPPAKADQPAALGRFYREARAAASLDHPNIVRTHDVDRDGDLHYIVMEYVDGSNLLEIVKKRGALGVGRAISYIVQATRGLDHAFRRGLVHRDIKPGNILVDRKGHARLLDMGLARFYRDHTDLLTLKYDDKVVLGTADYVAPEQIANSHMADIRADIYGLGATFYFLLAGHPPFPTGTVSQKLLWQRTKDPAPVEQICPDLPDGLGAIVARMMEKDPRGRFQTPGQLLAALEPWLPNRVESPSPDEMPTLSPAATRSRTPEPRRPASAGAAISP